MSDVPQPQILILDDDATHGASVQTLLQLQGFHAESTTDAPRAMQRLAAGEFAVLLLDINMPQITGIDVLEFLADQRIEVKTIVLSGESSASSVAPILRLGACDYLTKPFEPERLLTSVANALERRRLERENRELAARAQADHELHQFLVTASPDLIYVLDDEGRFTFANKPVSELIESAPADVRGLAWTDVLGPELAHALRHHFNERRTGARATRHFEFEYRTRTASTRLLEVSATGLYDEQASYRFIGTYGVLRDVTEARRTAMELAQSRTKFYGLFMDSPEASYIARLRDGRLIEANASFRAIQIRLGAAGDTNDAFLFPDAQTRFEFVRRVAAGGEVKTIAIDRETTDGVYHLELTAKALILNEETCLLATLHDRTEARRAERDRLNLQNRLQQASKMEAIGQLAGGIAHDFNNILASMIGYAELVQTSRQRFSATQIDGYLDQVITAGHRARDLIAQMLTFTRANRGEPRPVDVAAAIADVSRMLRAAIPGQVDIHTEIDVDLEPVQADPVQLQQIIINLMVNARDAIEGPGRIRVGLQRGRQQEACAACGDRLAERHLVLSVSDTGHGIPDDVRQRMFEMYFTTREPGKGTGIGLWLVNNLIHDHQGHVTVTSAPGTGTTFQVHLPLVGSQVETIGSDAPLVESSPADRVVMVVDDEVSVGNFISEVLRDAGYEVVLFHESPRALRYLQDHPHQVAVLVTDYNMPLISGQELALQAKRIDTDLPVVLITGFSAGRQEADWLAQGTDRFLAKPFRIEALLEAVAALSRRDRVSTV